MSVTTREEEGVLVVGIDDGKANVVSHELCAELTPLLDAVEQGDARAIVLMGREGVLSGGFDLGVMASGKEQAVALVGAGAELLMRLYELPRPVVVACTGHAIAMGALLLLAADRRLGAEGDFRIGLNEVAAGLTLPQFALCLARDRLSKRYFDRATVQAEMFAPEGARDAGFLDGVVSPEDLSGAAVEAALALAGLRRGAFAATKRRAHGPTVAEVRGGLATDLAELMASAD